MPLRLIADANAQTTIALALASGASSFVGGSTANFTQPQNFGNGQASLTILDSGNPAFNPAAPFATPFEYAYYTTNTVGTNTISGLTRGVANSTPHNFFAGATVAQGLLAEDFVASVPWKFAEIGPIGASQASFSFTGIPASYLGIFWRTLELRWVGRSTASAGSAALDLQFNGDTGANYNQISLGASGGTVSGSETLSATAAPIASISAALAAAGNGGQGHCRIDLFAGTTFAKIAESDFSYSVTTGSNQRLRGAIAAVWQSTAAITSILAFPASGSWDVGSWMAVWLIP